MKSSMGISNGLVEECKNENPGDIVWKCMLAPVSIIIAINRLLENVKPFY